MNTPESKLNQLFQQTTVPERAEFAAELNMQLATIGPKPKFRTRWALWLAIPTAAAIATVVFIQPQTKPTISQIGLKSSEALAESIQQTFSGDGTKHIITHMVRDDSGKVYNRVQKEYYINDTKFWLLTNETFDAYPQEHNETLRFSSLDADSNRVTDCQLNIGTDLLDHTSATGLESKSILLPLLSKRELCNRISSDQRLTLFAEPEQNIQLSDVSVERDSHGLTYLTFTTSEPVASNLLSVSTMSAPSIDGQLWLEPSVNTAELGQGDAFSDSDAFIIHNEPVNNGYKQRVQFVFMGVVHNGDNIADISKMNEAQVQFVALDKDATHFESTDDVVAASPIIKVRSQNNEYTIEVVETSVVNAARTEAAQWKHSSDQLLSNILGGDNLLQYMTEQDSAQHTTEGEYDVYVANLPTYADMSESYTVYVNRRTNVLHKLVDHVTYPEGETTYTTTFDMVETLPGDQTDLINEDQFYAKAQAILDGIDH